MIPPPAVRRVASKDLSGVCPSDRRAGRLADAAFESISITQDGVLIENNAAFLTLFGYDSFEQALGVKAIDLAAPESRALVAAKIAANDEEVYEAVLIRRDGTTFEAELRGRLIEVGGRPARVTSVRDVSTRNAAERALRESEEHLAEAQRVGRVGSWSWDVGSGRLLWSRELFRIFGLATSRSEPSFEELKAFYHPDDSPILIEAMQKCLDQGLPYEVDLRVMQPDGSYRWIHASGQREKGSDGRGDRLFGTAADIHERMVLEAELRDRAERLNNSERELRAVLESAPVVVYAADSEGIVTLSEGAGLRALGQTPGEVVGHSVFEFSDGNPEIEHYTRRALAGESVSFEAPYKSVTLHSEIRPARNAEGDPTGIIGVCFDVTERIRAEKERAQTEERFRVLFERSSDAHLIFDETGIIDGNRAAVALLGCSSVTELIGLHPSVVSPEYQPDGRRSDEKCIEMDGIARVNGFHRFEWTHRKLNGEEFPVEVTLTHVTLSERPALLVVWHDLTEAKRSERRIAESAAKLEQANAVLIEQQSLLDERLLETAEMNILLEAQRYQLERANERLSALATTDGLTGILNHRAFQERLEVEIARSQRSGEALSIALLDVDHFKHFNDEHGHQAGDAVLRAVSTTLVEAARQTDIVARYGGEEFAVILPSTNDAQAFEAAERLRHAIERINLEVGHVTASFGIATLTDSQPQENLIATADKAMYQSKNNGRNQTSPTRTAE